ncbi:hypothetical protein C8F01DRAFT_1371295 [Mycena amicta]|nr:hypothetical protein C8F01DRAFT_1371295 [Mycena amicta]
MATPNGKQFLASLAAAAEASKKMSALSPTSLKRARESVEDLETRIPAEKKKHTKKPEEQKEREKQEALVDLVNQRLLLLRGAESADQATAVDYVQALLSTPGQARTVTDREDSVLYRLRVGCRGVAKDGSTDQEQTRVDWSKILPAAVDCSAKTLLARYELEPAANAQDIESWLIRRTAAISNDSQALSIQDLATNALRSLLYVEHSIWWFGQLPGWRGNAWERIYIAAHSTDFPGELATEQARLQEKKKTDAIFKKSYNSWCDVARKPLTAASKLHDLYLKYGPHVFLERDLNLTSLINVSPSYFSFTQALFAETVSDEEGWQYPANLNATVGLLNGVCAGLGTRVSIFCAAHPSAPGEKFVALQAEEAAAAVARAAEAAAAEANGAA